MNPRALLDEIARDALDDEASLAAALRKVIALGGQLGSVRLREWAGRELHGYEQKEELPQYRRPAAVLMIDGVAGTAFWRGQQISPAALPEEARDLMDDVVAMRQGVGELEAMLADSRATGRAITLTTPSAPAIASLMDAAHGDPYQATSALYWSLSPSALAGVLDRIRTTLVELVAEMRVATPSDIGLPTAAAADQAVSVAVYGDRARVTVNAAQVTGEGQAAIAMEGERGLWVKVVGVATIVAALVAIAQWQGWGF